MIELAGSSATNPQGGDYLIIPELYLNYSRPCHWREAIQPAARLMGPFEEDGE